jgi:hypothetical protein
VTTLAPFPLPDTLQLPAAAAWSGTRARIYWLLRLTQERRHRHPMDTVAPTLGPAGWVPIHTLRATWAGGAAGDRRVRDLREQGVAYEVVRWSDLGGPRDSTATLYRLTHDALLTLNPAPITSVGERRHPSPPPPTTTSSAQLRTDLSRLRFWTYEGDHPADAGASMGFDPGTQHALAPPAGIDEMVRPRRPHAAAGRRALPRAAARRLPPRRLPAGLRPPAPGRLDVAHRRALEPHPRHHPRPRRPRCRARGDLAEERLMARKKSDAPKNHLWSWAPDDWRGSRIRLHSIMTGDRDLRLVYMELLSALQSHHGQLPSDPEQLETILGIPAVDHHREDAGARKNGTDESRRHRRQRRHDHQRARPGRPAQDQEAQCS